MPVFIPHQATVHHVRAIYIIPELRSGGNNTANSDARKGKLPRYNWRISEGPYHFK